MNAKNTCAHPGCNCQIPPEQSAKNSRFCCDHCEKAGTAAQGSASCNCGHASCERH